LVAGHASSAFFEGGYVEGIGEGEGRTGFGLEAELVGYTAVFVFVTSSLTNVLEEICQLQITSEGTLGLHTDFVVAAFAIDIG
jgi:hypothetical protein